MSAKSEVALLGTQAVRFESEPVDLMASLAALYPNGQLAAEQLAATKKALAQNPAALSFTAESVGLVKSQSASTTIQPQATAADFLPVTRVQNTTLYGAYFFSIYPTEVTSALAGNRNWKLEGPAFWASLANGTDLSPVHRFQNKQNGSYLYTIYDAERADIAANYSATFAYEGVAWYARQAPGTGWTPLYRFRNNTNGTYLFSAYESEKNNIVANFSNIFTLEGIAYYVRQGAPVDAPVDVPIGTFVQSLALTPSVTGNVTVGVSSSLSATASLSNGTTTNVTISSVWASSNTAVATVSASGVITARAPGTTTITASYGGQSATYSLTVVDAFVQTLTLTSTVTGPLPAGVNGKFIAVASFSNGTSKDVWADAIWTSSNTAVATPSLFGTFNTIAPGVTVITASYGGKSATYNLTVVNAVITNLLISNLANVLPQGDVYTLVMQVRYSNSTYVTVPGTWSSSAPSVATIDASGVLRTLAPGATTITANYNGLTVTKNITVATPLAAPLITVTCNSATPMVISAATWNSKYATDPTNTTKWIVTDWATCGTRAAIQLIYRTSASANFGYRVFEAVASPNNSFYPGIVTTSGSTPQLSAGSFIDIGYVAAAGNIIYNLLYTITVQ